MGNYFFYLVSTSIEHERLSQNSRKCRPVPRAAEGFFHTVGGRHNPLGGDDGASADVDALDVQADLPGPVSW